VDGVVVWVDPDWRRVVVGLVLFDRTVQHPEHARALSLADLLGLYSWHGRHHVAQIQSLTTPRR